MCVCLFESLCVCVYWAGREGARLLGNKGFKTLKKGEKQTNEVVVEIRGNSGAEPFPESSIGMEL